MTLDAAVTVRRGAFTLDAALRAEAGTMLAVLGPNGAGKTTLLRALAGLDPLDRGRVVLADRVLDDTTAGRRLAPQERGVGMVFQQDLLFPAMTVLENVAFGLRARGTAKEAARARARQLLETVGLADRADARPEQLSGGQRQRVALARALAGDPDLLLLDEPLAALDVGSRAEVRRELAARLDGLSCVRLLVTHDPVDALALADHVVVLEGGRVTQSGPIAEVAAHPTTAYLAELMGLNRVDGTATGGAFVLADGGRWPEVAVGVADGAALAVVHPRHVRLVDGPVRSDAGTTPGRATLAGVVTSVDPERDRTLVRVAVPWPVAAEAPPAAARAVRPGDRVVLAVDLAAVSCRPRPEAGPAVGPAR